MKIITYKNLILLLLASFSTLLYAVNYNAVDTTNSDSDFVARKIMEIKNDTSLTNNLIISGNRFFYTSEDGLVYCYDFNGNQKWIAEVFGGIRLNSLQYKDLFLSASDGGDIYSINANNGDVLQVIGVGENITTDLALCDVTNQNYKSKGVVFGTEAGNIYCYDIFSFEVIWKVNLSNQKLISNPLVINDKIIFKDSAQTIYSVNSKSGVLIWKFSFNKSELNNNSALLTDGKNIFTISPGNEISAIDLMLGKKNWATKTFKLYPQIEISQKYQTLITLDDNKALLFTSSNDGKESGKIILEKDSVYSFCFDETNGKSIIAFSDGSVYLLNNNLQLGKILNGNNLEIKSIKLIDNENFIIENKNGTISFYRITQNGN